ncbi:MAG: hypothetical protein ABJA90_04965 [Ginsengibacter sp.]
MKRLAMVFGVLCISVFALLTEKDKKKIGKISRHENDKDVEFTGPRGEKILVGTHGGKYYLKGETKVYIKKKK